MVHWLLFTCSGRIVSAISVVVCGPSRFWTQYQSYRTCFYPASFWPKQI